MSFSGIEIFVCFVTFAYNKRLIRVFHVYKPIDPPAAISTVSAKTSTMPDLILGCFFEFSSK